MRTVNAWLVMAGFALATGCGGGGSEGGTTTTSGSTAPRATSSTPAAAPATTLAPAAMAATGGTGAMGATGATAATGAVTDPASAAAGAASTVSAQAQQEADTIFTQRCVTCHGATGHGDGPAAAALNPKPRNYSLAEWQASVTDEEISHIIVQGGAAVGKSNLMPPNPDLANKPDVVKALVAKIRSFKQG